MVAAVGCDYSFVGGEGFGPGGAPPGELREVTLAPQSPDLFKSPTSKALVLLFVRTDCPIANRFAPEINRLAAEFSPRGVEFLRVYSAPSDTAEQVEKQTAEYGLTPPVLLDSTQQVARDCGARVTPEAIVMLPAGKTAYRGRIDDRFVDYGKARSEPSRRDLSLALEAVLAGQAVEVPETPAIGCPLEIAP